MKKASEMKAITLNESTLGSACEKFIEEVASCQTEKTAREGHRYTRILLTKEARETYFGWIFTEEEILQMLEIKFLDLGYTVSETRTKNANGLKIEW
jgi:hypothetical protein